MKKTLKKMLIRAWIFPVVYIIYITDIYEKHPTIFFITTLLALTIIEVVIYLKKRRNQ